MAEYGGKQRNQLSKVINRSESKDIQLQRFADNRPRTDSQLNLIHSIQKKPNNTGLPDNLKSGVGNQKKVGNMYVQINTPNKNTAVINSIIQKKSVVKQGVMFVDNRSSVVEQKKPQETSNRNPPKSKIGNYNIIKIQSKLMAKEGLMQRKVTVKGRELSSIVMYLNQVNYLGQTGWDVLLSLDETEAAGWMLGLSPTWNFEDAADIILFVNKVSSMTGLIRGIFRTGILSRTKLHEQGIDYVGSEDSGTQGDLAVNVLDNRKKKLSAQDITESSMIADNRGSISVALERQDDWIKNDLLRGGEVELSEARRREITEEYSGLASSVMALEQKNVAYQQNKEYLNGLANSEMSDRAHRTIMAVIPLSHDEDDKRKDFGVISERDVSYESTVSSGKISPGEGGFTTLIIPNWYQPFFLMLEKFIPRGIDVKFVGSKVVTATYKFNGEYIPVTIEAPDYASEVTPLLETFELLATHILTV